MTTCKNLASEIVQKGAVAYHVIKKAFVK